MPIASTDLPLRRGSKGQAVLELQRALTGAGEPLLVVDGDFGPVTERAVKALQKHHGLAETGRADAGTLRFLGLDVEPTADPFPPWMMPLWHLHGTKEVPGRGNNAVIMSLAPKIAKRFPSLQWPVSIFSSDEVPWCGAAVAYSVAEAGIMPDTRYPSALAWSDWGQKLNGPAVGAVAVKTRRGGGHVFFVAGRDGNNLAGLGGNQANSVKISPFNPLDITAYRWPPGVPLPASTEFHNLPRVGANGPVGQSEA